MDDDAVNHARHAERYLMVKPAWWMNVIDRG